MSAADDRWPALLCFFAVASAAAAVGCTAAAVADCRLDAVVVGLAPAGRIRTAFVSVVAAAVVVVVQSACVAVVAANTAAAAGVCVAVRAAVAAAELPAVVVVMPAAVVVVVVVVVGEACCVAADLQVWAVENELGWSVVAVAAAVDIVVEAA